MMDFKSRKRSALIACSDEWMCRSLQSLFEEKDYSAMWVESGKEALRLARENRFDVILLDERLGDLDAIEVCVALRDDPLFDHATPIVVTSSSHGTPRSRTATYAAGAWEYCMQPIDGDALFLKIATFLRARDQGLGSSPQHVTDPANGLYTTYGLAQVGQPLGAIALRQHQPFACLAVTPDVAEDGDTKERPSRLNESGFTDVANVVKDQSRKSDVVGRTAPDRLTILAPYTDADGVKRMVARLQRALDSASVQRAVPRRLRLRAGYCAVPDFAVGNVDLSELVHRAESALERTAGSKGGGNVISFDDLEPAH
ncbi:MAG TPA: response regulator [Gemmatimonadaceae bacterium]|nr:response regulator [Gemmatimonadaceae bacterium]